MRRPTQLWLLAALVAGCASPSVQEPDWLSALRDREAEPISSRAVASDDHFFQARVPARPQGAVTPIDDAYALRLDIGSETPMDCWIYREGLDFATSLGALSDSTFEAIGRSFGDVEQRQVEQVDAGVLAGHPFLAVDWLYRIASESGPQIGQVKHAIASKQGRGVYCQHNELGYAQSFRRVLTDLLASLEYAAPADRKPYFTQVSTLAIKGMRVGLERTTLVRDEVGDTRVDTKTSLLMPVTADTLQVSDTFGVEFARSDGSLINQVHVETSNGELVSQLELNPLPDDGWEVEGTFQTKPVSAKFRSATPPTSWLGEALALRQAISRTGVGSEIRLSRWVPQADPTRLVQETLSIERRMEPDHFAARLAMEGLEADLVVGADGSVASGSIPMGFASLEIERVYVGGAF
jgi:hypothetical protein